MNASRDELLDSGLAAVDALMSHRRRALSARPFHREISMPQLHLLMWLQERGPMTVSDLAHILGVSAPSASAFVDRMEEGGLVTRERNRQDRRVVHVRLEPRGRDLLEEITGMHREELQQLLAQMTDEELSCFVTAIRAVDRLLEAKLQVTASQ
jgi:DNA-binding MarR family transcriptional regulator